MGELSNNSQNQVSLRLVWEKLGKPRGEGNFNDWAESVLKAFKIAFLIVKESHFTGNSMDRKKDYSISKEDAKIILLSKSKETQEKAIDVLDAPLDNIPEPLVLQKAFEIMQRQVEEFKGKALKYDALVDSDGLIGFMQARKLLLNFGIKCPSISAELENMGVLDTRVAGKPVRMEYLKKGFFEAKERKMENGLVIVSYLFTQQGFDWFLEKMRARIGNR